MSTNHTKETAPNLPSDTQAKPVTQNVPISFLVEATVRLRISAADEDEAEHIVEQRIARLCGVEKVETEILEPRD